MVLNGTVTYDTTITQSSTYVYTTVATYQCFTGFVLSTNVGRTCVDGSNRTGLGVWTNPNLRCNGMLVQIVNCLKFVDFDEEYVIYAHVHFEV